MKTLTLVLWMILSSFVLFAQDIKYEEQKSIPYTNLLDSYAKNSCLLDFYYPKNKKDYITVIWFHGGGLTGGNRDIPIEFKNKDIAVVSVGYRFAPKANVQDIISDAAQAVRWTVDNIENYGGNKKKIVIAGYSAGGYLALMLALNKEYLNQYNIDVDSFLAVISFSGQAITHFTERSAMGMHDTQPLIDRMAPLYWVRGDALPVTLITGDRELEMLGRYEENAYLARMLKLVGHKKVKILELDGYGHDILTPSFPLFFKELKLLEK